MPERAAIPFPDLISNINESSRVGDAVQIAPYLTHVVRHHGKCLHSCAALRLTLVRILQAK